MRWPDSANQETVHRLKRDIIRTADGSTTIHLPDWDECYHSRNGAIAEAYHVFIRNGLEQTSGDVSILEIGFGTGLNALITAIEAANNNRTVRYSGVEAYPLATDEALLMNYPSALGVGDDLFDAIHRAEWDDFAALSSNFMLRKQQKFFQEIIDVGEYDLVYFDAFGYRVQPELWSEEIFSRLCRAMKPGGILVTYAARTIIRNNMKAAGFHVEKLPGPPGKREMLRAKRELL